MENGKVVRAEMEDCKAEGPRDACAREATLAERLQAAKPFVALGFARTTLHSFLADGDTADEAMTNARAFVQLRAEADAHRVGGMRSQGLPLEGLDVVIVRVEAITSIFAVTQRAVAVALNETAVPLHRGDRG